MPAIVGIDLGTTFSLVSVLQHGEAVLIPNALGEHLTASAVSVGDDGVFLVGAPARARAATHPTQTVTGFKRDMGTPRRFVLGGKELQAPDLSAMVLRALKEDAERYLGETVDEAVITVPAYFDELQRQATRDAGAIAGLKVDRILNEPTAAALAYGLHARDRQVRVAVLDLGGGTFDVTVLEIVDGVVEIQATAGDTRLGGEDFADELARFVAARLPAELVTDAVGWARLREACEGAKRRLSEQSPVSIALPALPCGGRRIDVEESLTTEDLEHATAGLLARLQGPIVRALRDANLRPEDIDEVLLVGGATRMPAVQRVAATLFGRLPLRALPPDEAIAMGAAVQAALKRGAADVADLIVTDVAPFTLGVDSGMRVGARIVSGLFTPMIERGTTIPASRVQRFSTMADGQTELKVAVFQGEHATCELNRALGQYTVKRIPPKPAGEEGVDIRFSYDLNGILEVETTVVSTGHKDVLVIEQTPGRLTRAQVEAARTALARLKFHPRDLLPNTTALARADARFVELTGHERALLGEALGAFRAALEGQDPAETDARRAALNALLARMGG
ncbi:MAG: Hsp70 family protein [Myxococcota bacterium]